MDTNANYTVAGAFVIILFSFIALAVIWLSSGLTLDTYTTYEVFMNESVSGLNIDAPVEFNGVNVGIVKSIQVNQKQPHLVELLLRIKSSTPVSLGTTASVNTRGLTGIGYIALLDNGGNPTPLKIVDGQPYPVIKTAPSLFLRWDTALTKLNESLSRASKALESVLDPENQLSIKHTLLNLQKITANLAAQNEKLNAILENTVTASQQFSPMLQAGKGAMQMLEMQTLPAANRIMLNLDEMSRNLFEISTELRQNPTVLLRGRGAQSPGPGEK